MLGFRVWDKEKQRFIKELVFAVNVDGELLCSDGDYEDCGTHEASDNFIPMQSTGLITEDHKPIFEGDIIGWEDGTHLQLVEDATTFVGRMGRRCKIQPDDKMILFYIHGNKYSNPELLEKVQC